MIDPEARQRLARLLKQLVAGKISNDDYQDIVLDLAFSSDASVAEIAHTTYIGFDDPFKTKCYVGKDAMSKRERRKIATWILFLQSDFEMKNANRSKWRNGISKTFFSLLHVILTFATCGLYLLAFSPCRLDSRSVL